MASDRFQMINIVLCYDRWHNYSIVLIFDELLYEFFVFFNWPIYYRPTRSEGYIFCVVRASVRPFRGSTLFVRSEPYLSTYWSELNHSLHK